MHEKDKTAETLQIENKSLKKEIERLKAKVEELEKARDDANGETRWVDFAGSRLGYDGGPAVLGSVFDVTERHQAVEALRESEIRYRQMFEGTPAVKLLVDPGTMSILEANDAAAGYFGFPKKDLSGMHVTGITPEPVERIKSDIKDILEGCRKPILVRTKHRNGEVRDVEVHAGPITLHGRTFINAIIFDITERKKVERELGEYQEKLRALASELTSSEERERRRLALELHDRIGQTLALCVARLKSIRTTLPRGELLDQINELLEFIDQTFQDSRALTFEISPPLLYDLGLEAALDWLAEYFSDLYRLPISVRDDNSPKPIDEKVKIVLFRAVRELFINIIKHSQSSKAEMDIFVQDSDIVIRVCDNGVGIDKEELEESMSEGFGLFNIKERLSSHGGSLKISSIPGAGSCFLLKAPLANG